MRLIQLLLPLNDNNGQPLPAAKFSSVRDHLAERFGGITVYKQAPAEGLNKTGNSFERDHIIVFEVMSRDLQRRWWRKYRVSLEEEFRQHSIVIRAARVKLL